MPIESIDVDVATGDDDLRPGSRAFVVLVGRDATGRAVDLAIIPLNTAGEKFADRTTKRVSTVLGEPVALGDIEFVELRFDADRGLGDDQWHCSHIRVVGLPDLDVLWNEDFPRDDRLTRSSPTRRSRRLSTFGGTPQIEFHITTGNDDLRSDSGGWLEAEMIDGRLVSQVFFGPFPNDTTRVVRFDLPEPVDVLPVHRVRVFFGGPPVGGEFLSVPDAIARAAESNDIWDLARLHVSTSDSHGIFDGRPGRLKQFSVFESPVLRPKVLAPAASQEFQIDLVTGADDLRVGGNPHSEVTVALSMTDGTEVPLEVRTHHQQPFVTRLGGGGAYSGSFETHGGASAIGRPPGGRPVTLANVSRIVVRMNPSVIEGIVGGTDIRGGDRWSLARIRLSVPADGRAGGLRTAGAARCLASFFNIGVKLDEHRRMWVSPPIR